MVSITSCGGVLVALRELCLCPAGPSSPQQIPQQPDGRIRKRCPLRCLKEAFFGSLAMSQKGKSCLVHAATDMRDCNALFSKVHWRLNRETIGLVLEQVTGKTRLAR